MTALKDISYQLVTVNLRLIAEVLGLGHFGALLDMAQREPVMIQKKGRAVAVILSMQDFKAHEAMKLKLLQQDIDEGLASGVSDRSMDELIAEAEQDAAADGPAGHA